MADGTKIEWTDATWNPITGCSVVSPGCTNCYAMRLAGTRLAEHPSRKGLTRDTKAGPVWTGEVRFNEQWLHQPLTWRKPRMVFVCAHGDLFHESVPDEWIDRIFAVMALSPQHVFQVLTKRPERMRRYVESRSQSDERGAPAEDVRVVMTAWLSTPSWRRTHVQTAKMIPPGKFCASILWPLPNVWTGVSVEDQRRAEERIPILRATPAALRWVSAEPLLELLDLTRIETGRRRAQKGAADTLDALTGEETWGHGEYEGVWEIHRGPRIDWVIVGGESGPGARVWDGFYDAARAIRDQCAHTGVAFFMKQTQGERKSAMPPIPTDLMIRQMPAWVREHNAMPEIAP